MSRGKFGAMGDRSHFEVGGVDLNISTRRKLFFLKADLQKLP